MTVADTFPAGARVRHKTLGLGTVAGSAGRAVSVVIDGEKHPRTIHPSFLAVAKDRGARGASGAGGDAPTIKATPYVRRDPGSLPPREFLYGRHLIRRFVSATIAPGAVGKSSLIVAEALAMATGRDLLGRPVYGGSKRVWLWNGEDPADELARRIEAACAHYEIAPAETEGRLFVDSGRDSPLVIAQQLRTGFEIAAPVVADLIATIHKNEIDVVMIDPFIASHRVTENDNNAIDAVVKVWGGIAEATNCAIELVHHARKTGGAEVGVEDGRGASALIAAARDARVLNLMTSDEGAKYGVENCLRYFRVSAGKSNLAVRVVNPEWHFLNSVDLGNGRDAWAEGDSVGVVELWRPPSPLAGLNAHDLLTVQRAIAENPGRCRADLRSAEWVGHLIGEALGIETRDATGSRLAAACQRVKGMIEVWIKSGALKTETGIDGRRNERLFVLVGEWATEPASPERWAA